jgi:hypothetical protein
MQRKGGKGRGKMGEGGGYMVEESWGTGRVRREFERSS